MRFGLDVANYGDLGDVHVLVDLALEAESCGWDGFFLWDHLVADAGSPVTDPWIVLAAVAARTERLRLGPMVTPLARRRTAKLARESVALDHLSGGRLVLGVGLGHAGEREFGAFGDPGAGRLRAEILDESLDVLAGLWSGQPFAYRGRHLHVAETRFLPTPLQQPRIPIWVAGLWPHRRPMRRAAAWDGAFPIDAAGDLSAQLSLEDMAAAITYLRSQRRSTGSFDIVHAGLMSGDRDRDAVLAQRYADLGVTWWLEHIYPGRMTVATLLGLVRGGPPRPG